MHMEWNAEKRKKLSLWIVGIAATCTVIFLGVQNIGVLARAVSFCLSLVSPLLWGLGLALVFNVPMRFFEAHIWSQSKKPVLQKLRRPLAFVISLLVIIGVLVGVVWLVIPELIQAIKVIVQSAVELVNGFIGMEPAQIRELPFGGVLLSIDWDGLLVTLQNWLKTQGSTIVNTAFDTIGSLVGGIYQFVIAFVFAVYILFSKDTLKAQATRLVRAWLPHRFGEWSIHAATVASANLRNFISGQSLEAVILGVLCMTGMLLLGLPYAPMVGALVGVCALIPVVGSFIGAFVGAFMMVTVAPIKAVVFLIYLLILQQLEGNLIYPRVMGSRVNLPGMWILAAVTVGGGAAGPLGMLLSVPVASTAYVLVKEATVAREMRRQSNRPVPLAKGDNV